MQLKLIVYRVYLYLVVDRIEIMYIAAKLGVARFEVLWAK